MCCAFKEFYCALFRCWTMRARTSRRACQRSRRPSSTSTRCHSMPLSPHHFALTDSAAVRCFQLAAVEARGQRAFASNLALVVGNASAASRHASLRTSCTPTEPGCCAPTGVLLSAPPAAGRGRHQGPAAAEQAPAQAAADGGVWHSTGALRSARRNCWRGLLRIEQQSWAYRRRVA